MRFPDDDAAFEIDAGGQDCRTAGIGRTRGRHDTRHAAVFLGDFRGFALTQRQIFLMLQGAEHPSLIELFIGLCAQ